MNSEPKWQEGLTRLYEEYVTTISTKKMAVSLQSATELAALCIKCQPKTILDFGSGFSSATLGHIKKLGLISSDIESVDSSPEWLGKTKDFLDEHELPVGKLTPLDDFSFEKRFDVILHDIGDMRRRATVLPHMWSMLNPGGWIVLDDTHKPRYRRAVNTFLSGVKHTRDEETSKRTVDQFNRYAFFVQKAELPIASAS